MKRSHKQNAETNNALYPWFISYGMPGKHLGVAVVKGHNPTDALLEASARGINPGGQVAIFPMTEEEANALGYNHLIQPDTMKGKGYKIIKTKEILAENSGVVVCDHCNDRLAEVANAS